MEYLAIGGLLIILGVREYLAYKERKEMLDKAEQERQLLLDRLMSRDIQEFKDSTVPDEEPEDDEEEQENSVNMALSVDEISNIPEDIREEITYGGQETE